jgi:hypothetical protein
MQDIGDARLAIYEGVDEGERGGQDFVEGFAHSCLAGDLMQRIHREVTGDFGPAKQLSW